MVMKSCLAKASHAWGPWGRGQLARCRGAQRGEGAAPSAPDWRQGRGTLRPHPPPPHHGHGLGAATAPSLIVRAREGRETGPAGNTAAATGGPGVWGSQALWTRTPRAVSGPLPCRRSERSCSLGRPGGSCRLWAATPPPTRAARLGVWGPRQRQVGPSPGQAHQCPPGPAGAPTVLGDPGGVQGSAPLLATPSNSSRAKGVTTVWARPEDTCPPARLLGPPPAGEVAASSPGLRSLAACQSPPSPHDGPSQHKFMGASSLCPSLAAWAVLLASPAPAQR